MLKKLKIVDFYQSGIRIDIQSKHVFLVCGTNKMDARINQLNVKMNF